MGLMSRGAGTSVCHVIRSLQETVQVSLISPHRPLGWFLPLLLHCVQGSGNPCVVSPSLLGLYKHRWPVYASSTETQQGTVPHLASCCLLVSPPWEPEYRSPPLSWHLPSLSLAMGPQPPSCLQPRGKL